jgi:hypothetical protein
MKEKLEILYGEYMHLHLNTVDYLPKKQYLEKMKAIEIILYPIVYGLPDPIKEVK